MRRRDFLKILLSTPIAAQLDVEKLLWVPKPIITVPALPWTYGAIDRATYSFWRNQTPEFLDYRRIEESMRALFEIAAKAPTRQPRYLISDIVGS